MGTNSQCDNLVNILRKEMQDKWPYFAKPVETQMTFPSDPTSMDISTLRQLCFHYTEQYCWLQQQLGTQSAYYVVKHNILKAMIAERQASQESKRGTVAASEREVKSENAELATEITLAEARMQYLQCQVESFRAVRDMLSRELAVRGK